MSMQNSFLQKMDPAKTLLVTPNKRLAVYLGSEYDRYQKNLKNKTWISLTCLPLESWLRNIWHIYLENEGILLNAQQRSSLWQQIIKESNPNNAAAAVQSLADIAEKAWDITQKWQMPLDLLEPNDNDDARTFQIWAEKYISICEKKRFIDPCYLPTLLINALDQKQISLPYQKIILAGFDQVPNQTIQLISALRNAGYDITHLDPNHKQNRSKKSIEFKDQKTEILSMALWAKNRLEKNSQSSIGCIVADLGKLRDQIEHIFQQVFQEKKIFNISLGKKLTAFPMIQSGLNLLKLGSENDLSFENIIGVFYSPFLANAEAELITRARCESELLSYNKPSFSWQSLLEHLNPRITLTKILKSYRQFICENAAKCLQPSEWVKIFSDCLQILGWPGERTLDSSEYQLMQRWKKLLYEFATLDAVITALPHREACQKLSELADNIIFQPEQGKTSVNILGTLEATGMNFDHLWVLGADDEHWPKEPAANPFIPLKWQKRFGLQHSSSEGEYTFSKTLIERFARSADEIIYSYASTTADREVSISPLLSNIEKIQQSSLELDNFIFAADEIRLRKKTEFLYDCAAPQVSPRERIRGGSNILKLQALCPFRAFAECRLNARKAKTPQFGLERSEHGSLIHAVLEDFWRDLKSHNKLCALSPEKLQSAITRSLDSTLGQMLAKADAKNTNLLKIERRCLIRLLSQWLEFEKSRPFFDVIALEKRIAVDLGKLQLRLRIDRIDRMQNGELIIIDYKTGKSLPSVADWFGERPEDPQLPLYCITTFEPIGGLVFAKINIAALGFAGITKKQLEYGRQLGQADNWEEMLQNWRQVLENLAQDFYLGKAETDPKDPQKTCRFCELAPLCRIQR